MDEYYYRRPREKLLSQGVAVLSRVELIQVIVSSGSQKAKSGTIARSVEKCIQRNTYAAQDLLTIQGVGMAKACQLVAAIELGARVLHDQTYLN